MLDLYPIENGGIEVNILAWVDPRDMDDLAHLFLPLHHHLHVYTAAPFESRLRERNTCILALAFRIILATLLRLNAL